MAQRPKLQAYQEGDPFASVGLQGLNDRRLEVCPCNFGMPKEIEKFDQPNAKQP